MISGAPDQTPQERTIAGRHVLSLHFADSSPESLVLRYVQDTQVTRKRAALQWQGMLTSAHRTASSMGRKKSSQAECEGRDVTSKLSVGQQTRWSEDGISACCPENNRDCAASRGSRATAGPAGLQGACVRAGERTGTGGSIAHGQLENTHTDGKRKSLNA